MSKAGEQTLQAMKEHRQIERIHAIYQQFMNELKQLDTEQTDVIKQILAQIDHDSIQKILTTIKTTK